VYNLINYRAPVLALSSISLMLIVSDCTNFRRLNCHIKEKVNHVNYVVDQLFPRWDVKQDFVL